MNLNYMLGKQMVIMDPRLGGSDGPVGTGANVRPLAPPAAYNRWMVNPTEDMLEHILDHAGAVASGVDKLDAIHFIGHGGPGWMQMGVDGISTKNIALWSKLRNKVKVIVLYGCNTGMDIVPGQIGPDGTITSLGQGIAAVAEAKVIVCKEGQQYQDAAWHPSYGNEKVFTGRGGGLLNFWDFRGDVYVCSHNGDALVVARKDPSDRLSKSTLNLTQFIFSQN